MTTNLFLFALLGAVANMIIGSVWYSQKLFGKVWMKDAKVEPKKITQSAMIKAMVFSFLGYIVISLVIGWLRSMYMGTLGEFLTIIAIFWMAFVFCIRLTHALFEQKPFRYVAITSAHDLLGILAAAAIVYYA